MACAELSKIRKQIEIIHGDDTRQLDVIFSESERLLVEAPAGYGKTTTMISRIAYLIASDIVPNPKRILGLTFSVNAALKIKRDVSKKLPVLLGSQNNPVALGDRVTVTNYHGFCKGILKKYGYLLGDIFRGKDIYMLKAVEEDKLGEINRISTALVHEDIELLKQLGSSVKSFQAPDMESIRAYNNIVMQKLIPFDYITHNAVILLALNIFARFPEVKRFYRNYYHLLVVDEFQDTNCISWMLLQSIIDPHKTQLLFLGDPLQRIYGFIGALPNIMGTASTLYSMTTISLEKNHRFKYNDDMRKLDINIRANAATAFSPEIKSEDYATLPAFWGRTQQEEAQKVLTRVENLIDNGKDRVAILFRSRGPNTDVFEQELSNRGIQYFYGMFKEDDPVYVDFHIKCQDLFVEKFGKSKSISSKSLYKFSEHVKVVYSSVTDKTIVSLLRLLDALVAKVSVDYAELLPSEKYILILDIFENRQLKQAMEYVDAQVILSTIHGAKGLEWDYVILADLERNNFPSYYTCKKCGNSTFEGKKRKCQLPTLLPSSFQKIALEELSLFYVAVTRARRVSQTP